MKTRENSFLSIKSKLTAAVAMLLVAFFMVVSSSFAWFTLSTAPEVTGITTTVGANGNLEIALLYDKENPTKTLSELASSVKTGFVGTNPSVTKTNTYWGNLVSLSDPKGIEKDPYGLEKIKLLPSRLNAASTTAISMAIPLAVPEYVAVGQPSTLNKNTLSGIYKNEGFTNSGYGVRGIGTQSTMSQQELDWRSASQNYSSAISRAAALTNSAISGNNGQALVNIVVGYAAGDTEFKTHVGTVAAIITALENGLMSNLETAKVEALKAIYAKAGESAATYVSPANVVVTTEKNGDTYTITATVAGEDVSEVSQYTAFKTLCEKTYDIDVKLREAITNLNALYETDGVTVKSKVSWEEISGVLTPLFDANNVKIGTKTYADIQAGLTAAGANTAIAKAEWILANCMNDADKSFTVNLEEGSGIFADVHKVTGKQVKTTAYYMNIIPVHMQTNVATPSTINMDALKPNVNTQKASPYLTDLYGYALDFAFRTNAKGSNLLLSEAANRIYSNSTNEETMGHGSVMKFSSSDPKFLATDVADLMGCLRVVFTDVNGNILAVGAADRDADGKIITTLNGDEVTAKIVLYDWELLYDTNDDNNHGKLTLKGKETTQAITALNQNQATVISAYVFLDGDATDNAKVGTGTESMTGSINLQFASDAELKPMDYADLKGQTTTTATTATTTATN